MYASADNLVVHGFKREIQALQSATLFIKGDKASAAHLSAMIDKLGPFEKESRRDLADLYRRTCASLGIPAAAPELSAEESALRAIIPKPNPHLIGALGLVNNYPDDKYAFPKLGALVTFSYELLNLMDGKRNLLEILQAVRAEALSSNLETFPVKDVREFVEALKKAEVVSY